MKKKVSWWQALLAIAVLGGGIYFIFSYLEASQHEAKEATAEDAFAGTTVGKISQRVVVFRDGERDSGTLELWKLVAEPLEKNKLLEKDTSPEALGDIRRNVSVVVEAQVVVTGDKAVISTALVLERELPSAEGGSFALQPRRVSVTQKLAQAPEVVAEAELNQKLEDSVSTLADDLVKHLVPTAGQRVRPYLSGGSKGYERSISGPPPPGARAMNVSTPGGR